MNIAELRLRKTLLESELAAICKQIRLHEQDNCKHTWTKFYDILGSHARMCTKCNKMEDKQ